MSSLTHQELVRKTAVACFAKPEVTQDTREAFEDGFASGRDGWDVWNGQVTTSYSDKSVEELVSLCLTKFDTAANPYYPFWFVVLDERTNRDGSVLLVENDHRDAEIRRLRTNGATLAVLLSCMEIQHTNIEDVLVNDAPEESEPAFATWFYDVPIDSSDTHDDVRVPLSEFEQREGPTSDFTVLRMSKERVAGLGLPEVDVQLVWFGEPPATILLQCAWAEKKPEQRHVTGEKL